MGTMCMVWPTCAARGQRLAIGKASLHGCKSLRTQILRGMCKLTCTEWRNLICVACQDKFRDFDLFHRRLFPQS